MSISDRLKKWRAYKKLTQKNAGELLGISPGVYQKYEMGLRAPGAEVMDTFLRAGINVNWLLSGEGPMLVADYSTKPSERDINAIESAMTAEDMFTTSAMDEKCMVLAIKQIEDELKKIDRWMEPEAKARVVFMAYRFLIDEENEKKQASVDNVKKIISKLMKS